MSQVDSAGYMKVDIGGDIVRRRAHVQVLCVRGDGQAITHATPELRAGEILCERIGMLPCIVMGATQSRGWTYKD